MAKRKKPASANRGAADTRNAIKRKVQWLKRNARCTLWNSIDGTPGHTSHLIDADDILDFIDSMDTRAAKRKGGLGRK